MGSGVAVTLAVVVSLLGVLCVGFTVDAATLVLDLQEVEIPVENNVARFPIDAQFLPDDAADRVQSVQIGLDTDGNFNAFHFVPASVFDGFFADFDPSDAPSEVNAFMSINDLFNDGLAGGFHTIGVIEVNLLQAGIAVGDPLLIDITRLNIDTGTSGIFANLNNVSIPAELNIAFIDLDNSQDPQNPTPLGTQTFIVPERTGAVPEPGTTLLILLSSLSSLGRRRTRDR